MELAGTRLRFAGLEQGPSARLEIVRPLQLARRALWRGDVGFAEGYMAGDWTTPDLQALLQTLALNGESFLAAVRRRPLPMLIDSLLHWRNRNTRSGSRRNISSHYDLGNDFYALWLDDSMTYSSAIFDNGREELAVAQQRKYARLLDRLGATPGQHVLEIGCGWGGFALEAAHHGLQVKGLTLSREQLAWACRTLDEAGMSDRVELVMQDYRDEAAQYDHIVSIEMFEAVGEEYWPTYMETLKRCLKASGRAALQVITIDEKAFEHYRATPDFIQRYIFPGGVLPSVERFTAAAETGGLRVVEAAAFGRHYAETLARWHLRFDEQEPALRSLGFDDRFLRMWRYYLAYCEAGFRTGRIDLYQMVLEHR